MKKIICIIATIVPLMALSQTDKSQAKLQAEKSQNKETMVEITTNLGTMRFKLIFIMVKKAVINLRLW